MKHIAIDGRQLSYPGTGLALVSAEFLRAFQQLGYASYLSVFVEKTFNVSDSSLADLDVQWIPIDFQVQQRSLQHWLARAATIPDHLERLAWGAAVTEKLREFKGNTQHFIPYLYNYGDLNQNVVLIPDLIYRLVREETIDSRKPWWWNLRYKIPLRSWFRQWEEKQAISAKKIVVYSQFVRDFVVAELGVAPEKINLVPLATPSWVTQECDLNRAIIERYNLPKRFILYVGGFSPRKNIPLLLRACGQVYERDRAFRCVFVGLTEEFIQSGFGTPIREAMSSSSVRAAMVELPKLSYSELASLYRLADFTVYPSLSEGFGLPILEAAAAGKLCLCGDNSSMRELQPDARYRLDSTEEEAWVEAILKFWKNPTETEIASQNCSELVRNYSWRQSAEKLWELLQQ